MRDRRSSTMQRRRRGACDRADERDSSSREPIRGDWWPADEGWSWDIDALGKGEGKELATTVAQLDRLRSVAPRRKIGKRRRQRKGQGKRKRVPRLVLQLWDNRPLSERLLEARGRERRRRQRPRHMAIGGKAKGRACTSQSSGAGTPTLRNMG